MDFFKSTRHASRPGTAAYARELADAMHDGVCLGVTDATIAAKALRSRAACGLRRAGAAFAVIVVTAGIAVVGVADGNGDGRVDIVDVARGVKSVVVFGRIRERTGTRERPTAPARHASEEVGK